MNKQELNRFIDKISPTGPGGIEKIKRVLKAVLDKGGEEGITEEELLEALATKQDTIQDLSEIRSGTALGATAYQKPSAGIPASDMTDTVQQAISFAESTEKRSYNSSNPDGMGYLVLKKNKTFAEQVTEENTIYEIRYEFTLSSDFVIPSGCSLLFKGGKITGEYTLDLNGGTVSANNGEHIFGGVRVVHTPEMSVKWVGAKGDGINDDTGAFQKLAAWANSESGRSIIIPSGRYMLNNTIFFNSDVSFCGYGKDTILDFTGGVYGIAFLGTYIDLGITLVANAIEGTNQIQLSDISDLEKGDILAFINDDDYSYSPLRAVYKQGEYVTVDSISENTVVLSEDLYATYKVEDNIKLYKLSTITVNIRDFSVVAKDTGAKNGVNAVCCDYVYNSHISGLTLSGTNNSHLYLSHAYKCTISDVNINYLSTPVGLNYGIYIGNSQSVIVHSCFLRSTRHGLTTGGSAIVPIVNRDIVIDNCFFGGDISTPVLALDNHENTEYFCVQNCNIEGGCRLSGNHIIARGNTIKTKSAGEGINVNSIGDDVEIVGNSFLLVPNSVSTTIIGVRLTNVMLEQDKTGGCISIRGNRFVFVEQVPSATYIGIGQTSGQTNTLQRLDIRENSFVSYAGSSVLTSLVRAIFLVSYINEVSIVNNYYAGRLTSIFISNRTENAKIKVLNCFLDTHSSEGEIAIVGDSEINDVVISGCIISQIGTVGVNLSNIIVRCGIFDNIIYGNNNNTVGIQIRYITSACVFAIERNKVVNCHVCIRAQGTSSYIYSGLIKDNILGKETEASFNQYANYPYFLSYISSVRIEDNNLLGSQAPNVDNTVINLLSHNGTSARRPTASSAGAGFTYFDTDLGKMIVSNGTAWVNIDGSAL